MEDRGLPPARNFKNDGNDQKKTRSAGSSFRLLSRESPPGSRDLRCAMSREVPCRLADANDTPTSSTGWVPAFHHEASTDAVINLLLLLLILILSREWGLFSWIRRLIWCIAVSSTPSESEENVIFAQNYAVFPFRTACTGSETQRHFIIPHQQPSSSSQPRG